MAGMEVKHAGSPDETRPFVDKGRAEVVNVGGTTIIRGTFEPGWRWSQHVPGRAHRLRGVRAYASADG